jgi:glycerate 2-kinase
MREEGTIGELVNKVLKLSDPRYWLARKVEVRGRKITVEGKSYETSRTLLIAAGKASVPMAEYFLNKVPLVRAIVVTPVFVSLQGAEVIVAEHPVPGEGSLRAGEVVAEALKKEDYDLVLFLLSGGSSSLLELTDMGLEELRTLNERLIKSGLSINEINAVRKHLSKIKGGQLAKLSKSRVVTIAVSDVPGNDPSTIGSGPTVPDTTTVEDAKEALKRVGLEGYEKYLRETPKEIDNSDFFLLLDAMTVLKEGFSDWLVLTSEARGEAKSLGLFLASIANSSPSTGLSKVALAGEPEVRVEGKAGKGGRNGEVCLGYYLGRRVKDFALLALASDGLDGNSEYAGCYVDGELYLDKGEALSALELHDSYGLLERYGRAIRTGFTFTNVNNFYFLFRHSR